MSKDLSLSFQGIPVIMADWALFKSDYLQNYSSYFILTDKNVAEKCLQSFLSKSEINIYQVIKIEAGEEYKNFDSVQFIINHLINSRADRKSLLINLGGGMVTDMGGFCASIYKRGIDFINVPTSLLAMADAAIGGKTGIDHQYIKNVVGSFSLPKAVLIDTLFLNTLSKIEFLNGMGEVFKHAIIADADLWEALKFMSIDSGNIPIELLAKAIKVKTQIVDIDFLEKEERKVLNFGHTIGHAIEALYIKNGNELPHGFAVAAGMWIESWINNTISVLSNDDFEEITSVLEAHYAFINIDIKEFDRLLDFIRNDKKSSNHQIQITQILSIGFAQAVLIVTTEDLKNGLSAYIKRSKTLKNL